MENKQLIAAIRECNTREDLEKLFKRFDVVDTQTKYTILVESMYSPQMFFSVGSPSIEQQYEFAVEQFLSMTWKISAMYEKMGM
ncbi:MAG: hypothetical protein II811_03590 [Spirochaetaceae bacterium]|nr:hypothetical protein [Spirochaetaceae bacterium]